MKEIFNDVLETFENEDIKEFAEACLQSAPPYWYEVPASSSGKFHPLYALGDGGLVRHTIALIKFLNYMFAVESIGDMFTSRERDLLRVAGLAHDMMKSGTQEDYEKNKWTKFDHPLLAARMIQSIDGLSREEKIFIGKAIVSHMGAFNTDKRHPDIILPKPQDKYQIILHLADYLASRKDIEMKFDNTLNIPIEPPDAKTWKMDFGKYKGLTLQEIQEQHPDYIEWLQTQDGFNREPCKSLLIGMGYKFKN